MCKHPVLYSAAERRALRHCGEQLTTALEPVDGFPYECAKCGRRFKLVHTPNGCEAVAQDEV